MTELEKAAERYCNQSHYDLGIEYAFISGAEWAFQNRDIEKVLCAACYFPDGNQYNHQPRNIDMGFVVSGWRHHNCISLSDLILRFVITNSLGELNNAESYHSEFVKYRNMEIQGFLTSKGRFVDRKEAAEIAYSAGQISDKKEELYSEDLY